MPSFRWIKPSHYGEVLNEPVLQLEYENSSGKSGSILYSVGPVEFFEKPVFGDVARNRPVSIVVGAAMPAYPVSRITDGTTSVGRTNGYNGAIQVDLGEVYFINYVYEEINIFSGNMDDKISNSLIQTSLDGTNWSTVYRQEDGERRTHGIQANVEKYVRYIRCSQRNTEALCGWRHLQAFEGIEHSISPGEVIDIPVDSGEPGRFFITASAISNGEESDVESMKFYLDIPKSFNTVSTFSNTSIKLPEKTKEEKHIASIYHSTTIKLHQNNTKKLISLYHELIQYLAKQGRRTTFFI